LQSHSNATGGLENMDVGRSEHRPLKGLAD